TIRTITGRRRRASSSAPNTAAHPIPTSGGTPAGSVAMTSAITSVTATASATSARCSSRRAQREVRGARAGAVMRPEYEARGCAAVAPGRRRCRSRATSQSTSTEGGAAPGPMRRRARGRDRGAHEHRFSLLTACTTPSADALAADHRAGLALAAVAADLAVAARAGPAPRRPDPLRHRRGVDRRGGRGPHPPPRAHADPHRGAARRDRHGRGLGDPGRRAGRGPRRAVADAARAGHLGRDGRAAGPGAAGRPGAGLSPLRWACGPRGKVLILIGRRTLLAAAATLPLTVLAGFDGFSTTSLTEQEFPETL